MWCGFPADTPALGFLKGVEDAWRMSHNNTRALLSTHGPQRKKSDDPETGSSRSPCCRVETVIPGQERFQALPILVANWELGTGLGGRERGTGICGGVCGDGTSWR